MQAHKDLHLQTNHSCNQCPADIHTFPYTDVSKHPCWEGREFTDVQFKSAFPDRAALLDVDGVTHRAIGMDSMHNKHLGMDLYYAGSVLYLLVYVILSGHQGAHLNKWAASNEWIMNLIQSLECRYPGLHMHCMSFQNIILILLSVYLNLYQLYIDTLLPTHIFALGVHYFVLVTTWAFIEIIHTSRFAEFSQSRFGKVLDICLNSSV